MSKPDINFLSITEPGTVIENRDILVPVPIEGTYWSDAVHVNVPNVILRHCVIDARNCEENAFDSNEGHNFLMEDCVVYAGQQCALYAKATRGGTFRRVRLVTVGGHSDGYLGDYSDQSREKTTGIVFDSCYRDDGQPFRAAWNFRRSEKPRCLAMARRYQWLWSLVRTVCVEAKYLFN